MPLLVVLGLGGLPAPAQHFEEAIRKDPDYALAYAQLAHAYAMIQYIRGLAPNENTVKFLALTRKALELDDKLAEAHVNLGDIRFYGDWEWSAGEPEFRHAVELDRGSVDAQEHYVLCLDALRRYDTAARQARRALRQALLKLMRFPPAGPDAPSPTRAATEP